MGLGFILSLTTSVEAQKLIVSKSLVSFFSDGLLEDISAENSKVQGILNLEDGAFFIRIPMAMFEFESDLMKEHFNENYLESEKFPTATFKGKLERTFKMGTLKNVDFFVQGQFVIHGVSQDRSLNVTIVEVKEGLEVKGKFDVLLEDHNIEIPTIVFQKIAETIAVEVQLQFIELKK